MISEARFCYFSATLLAALIPSVWIAYQGVKAKNLRKTNLWTSFGFFILSLFVFSAGIKAKLLFPYSLLRPKGIVLPGIVILPSVFFVLGLLNLRKNKIEPARKQIICGTVASIFWVPCLVFLGYIEQAAHEYYIDRENSIAKPSEFQRPETNP